MAGVEREFVGLKLEITSSYAESMTREAGASSEQTIADLHQLEEHALRPYSFVKELAGESAHMGSDSNMNTHHEFFEYHPYLDSSSGSQALGALLPTNLQTNLTNVNCHDLRPTAHFMTNGSPRAAGYLSTHDTSSSVTSYASVLNHMNRDMGTLQRELEMFKGPKSSEFLRAITTSAEGIFQKYGSGSGSGSVPSSDDEEAPDTVERDNSEEGGDIQGAIINHPFYPELVLAHLNIFKIGAPKGLRLKLEDLTKKYQKFSDKETSELGDDPELDHFMRSYVDFLSKFREDMEEPFDKFLAYKESITKQLEDICGHYVDTGPDEDENYGLDIGPMDGTQEDTDLEALANENLQNLLDIHESIVIDPMAPDKELRKVLMKRYGRYIGGLKAEFLRVRKTGKLPPGSRQILKDWFNHRSHWPYPNEEEKAYLQKVCDLNLKQINNWFINERKRHWSCEGKCMHPNTKFS